MSKLPRGCSLAVRITKSIQVCVIRRGARLVRTNQPGSPRGGLTEAAFAPRGCAWSPSAVRVLRRLRDPERPAHAAQATLGVLLDRMAPAVRGRLRFAASLATAGHTRRHERRQREHVDREPGARGMLVQAGQGDPSLRLPGLVGPEVARRRVELREACSLSLLDRLGHRIRRHDRGRRAG